MMLTEFGMPLSSESSPFTSLGDYPKDSSEFQYIDAQLPDPYCDPIRPPSPPPSPPKTSSSSNLLNLLYSSPDDVSGGGAEFSSVDQLQQPFLDSTSHYENDLVSLDRVTSYDDLKYSDIKFDMKYDDLKYDEVLIDPPSCSSSDQMVSETPQQSFGDSSSAEYSPPSSGTSYAGEEDCLPLPQENSSVVKGKVSDLQRTALDSIFQITDRPSRTMVLYIASELHLNHVTVKNFFSNARRRVRRAAARLSDPERSRRENRRRKEKRRLAAIAAAAAAEGQLSSDSAQVTNLTKGPQGEPVKEPSTLSPQRKALMEKLADKVQRSAAQRNLTSLPETSAPIPPPSSSSAASTPSSCSIDLNECSWPQNILGDAFEGYQQEVWDMPQLF